MPAIVSSEHINPLHKESYLPFRLLAQFLLSILSVVLMLKSNMLKFLKKRIMGQKCNPEKENHPITWKEAGIRAFGWLGFYAEILVIPIMGSLAGWRFFMSTGILVVLILFFTFVTITTRLKYHSWRVSIAFLIELCHSFTYTHPGYQIMLQGAAAHPV